MSLHRTSQSAISRALVLITTIVLTMVAGAQTTGQGGLEGTVLDPSGAAVPSAVVSATNQATGIASVRKSSSAGFYSVAPLTPGIYTVTITAPGFSTLKQENIEVNGLTVTGLNLTLQPGTNETITVTDAPPQLQVSSATVGAVITNETYEELPLVMNNQQRDPTAFATLAPGAQSGARAPIFSGTGNYLAEVYIDGVPTTTINQQGDNRVVSNGIPVEAVEQLQIISSAPSAEYQGAGAINFAIKNGGNKYHGHAVAVFRNTALDTWGFAGNQATQYAVVNGVLTQKPAGKSFEHQFEASASVGGPIPFTRGRGFFFTNYDQFHSSLTSAPALFTVPTALMKQGDFTELNCSLAANSGSTCLNGGVGLTGAGANNPAIIYNPLTNTCIGSTCSRQPFQGLKGGVATNNVIPSQYLSSISLFEQKYLPDPNLPGISQNYLASGSSGYDNHEIVAKVSYDITKSQRISLAYIHGVRQNTGLGSTLPLPYTTQTTSTLSPTFLLFQHNWVVTPHMVNQLSYGFTRFPQIVTAPTDGNSDYSATAAGITGLPSGQAAGNFPTTSFASSAAFSTTQTTWVNSSRSYITTPNAYNVVDNFVWTKGKHNLTFGVLTQWLQSNAQSQTGASGIFTQAFSPNGTANYVGSTLTSNSTSTPYGYSYASFLLGAVNSSSTSVNSFTETGSRFHPISPYVQDDWKLTPRLTMNLGLRWDYMPSYREVLDRWSYLNTGATNPLTSSPGELEFAGNRGSDISCQCRTPVPTWKKNFGPRLGLEYAPTDRTVVRAGYAIAYSHAGGVGGRGSGGPSTLGFTSSIVLPSASTTGASAGPSYYLNNSAAFQTAGAANTNFGGAGYSIPAPSQPSAASLTLDTGNYVVNGKAVTPGGAPAFVDPYLASRAPMFEFYNFGVQQALTKDMTFTINYSGSQSHFVAGATVPGYWSGQLDPSYLVALGSTLASDNATNILSGIATPANLAIAQNADRNVTVPYAGYAAAGALNLSTATIGRMVRPFPQYSSPPTSTYANIANISYNALEITLKQRASKGINFTLNYTWSRNIGDDGTSRTAFAVPASASSSGVSIPGNNRADRDIVTTDLTHNMNVYGVFKSPFGKDKFGSKNWAARNLLGGWDLSEIFTARSGTPIYITASGCTNPSGGTCMPDLIPGKQLRKNGAYGSVNHTYTGFSQTSYLDGTAFALPNTFPLPAGAKSNAVAVSKIGTAPRYLGLRNPVSWNLDAAVSRTFPIVGDRLKFVFRADCNDVFNHVYLSMGQAQTWSAADATNPGASSFGKLDSASGNRKFQLTGRLVF